MQKNKRTTIPYDTLIITLTKQQYIWETRFYSETRAL